jgi:hypothetical protein
MKWAIEVDSGGTIYIQSFMKTAKGLESIWRFAAAIGKALMLVILVGTIYEVSH